MHVNDYVLRISTVGCNLNCDYCRKENFYGIDFISDNETLDIIRAAAESGIRAIRWTGGEPLFKRNFEKMVEKTKSYGIEKQMLSTNGTLLYERARGLYDAGINRVNISLDTLDKEKFEKITGSNLLDNVLRSIEISTDTFELVKINRVLENENLSETMSVIELAHSYEGRKSPPVVRFIELVKGGFDGDIEYVKNNHCSGERVLEVIRENYGNITETNVCGDNPMCYYYKIDSNNVNVGIVPNFSVNFQCGGKKCKKLRVNPTGFTSNCSIYKQFGYDLKGKTYEEKLKLMKDLIKEKDERDEEVFRKLKHHQSDYQFWRFGKPRKE